MSLNVKPGMPLQKTKDLFTSPGRIDLVHENPKTLDEDYRTIRRAEIDCLYECES